MSEFASLIFPALELVGCRTVTEIGVEGGAMTSDLLEYVEKQGGWMTAIDPSPSAKASALLHNTPFAVLHRDLSVRAIRACPPTDAYLVDGDHNYFTVMQELLSIERMQKSAQKPFLAILHDVAWPWAYRDLYYNPDAIPSDWRKPYTWDQGVTLDKKSTISGGFRGCGAWACAIEEGGDHNGVLKAVEDFIETRPGAIQMALIPAVFGLAIVYDARARWAEALQKQLEPFDRNPILERMERNRLENYLRVIELQDQQEGLKEKVHVA